MTEIKEKLQLLADRCRVENYGAIYVLRLVTSWLLALIVYMIVNGFSGISIFDKQFLENTSPLLFISTIAVIYILLSVIKINPFFKGKNIEAWLVLILSGALTIICSFIAKYENLTEPWIWLALTAFFALALKFTLGKFSLKMFRFAKKLWVIYIAIAAAIMLVFSALAMAMRYYALYAPAFDFGLFAQMYENMKNTLQPVTTLERGYELSHFAVHFSPAYYLLLPIYMLFPHPVTLQIMQGVLIASGCIPVFLICRKYNFSKLKSSAVAVIFLFYPLMTGGCCYDFHENFMLVPFMLWLFWAIETEKTVPIIIFSLFTLMVKEDAAVYIAVVGLYLVFSNRSKKIRITGAAMMLGAVIYFIAACAYINSQGLGTMDWRYSEYMTGDGGLVSVILSVICNPVYAVTHLLSAEKAIFLLQTLVPLGFIPLISRYFHRYILLIPLILVNLMPSWQYQYSIYYQYVFGSGVLLFWLFIMNLSDMKYTSRRNMVAFCVVASITAFSGSFAGMVNNYKISQKPVNIATIEFLEQLPADGEVIYADTFFTPALYKQAKLYSVNNLSNEMKDTAPDIVLLSRTSSEFDKHYQKYAELNYNEAVIDSQAAQRVCMLIKP